MVTRALFPASFDGDLEEENLFFFGILATSAGEKKFEKILREEKESFAF